MLHTGRCTRGAWMGTAAMGLPSERTWLTTNAAAALATLPSGLALDASPSCSMMAGRGTAVVQRRLSVSEVAMRREGRHGEGGENMCVWCENSEICRNLQR